MWGFSLWHIILWSQGQSPGFCHVISWSVGLCACGISKFPPVIDRHPGMLYCFLSKAVDLYFWLRWSAGWLDCVLAASTSSHPVTDRHQRLFFYIVSRSQIHERTITLRFLGIILRVLRHEVSVWFFLSTRKGVWFFYQVFLLSPLQKL